ncbi:MAG TPA: aerial mycelium formation protein [Mycobacteriales bacterium]|nr:aerial mycelium formation protein [Mycobacteriales bacterium]
MSVGNGDDPSIDDVQVTAPTGNRRIDRVLAEDFLEGLQTASLTDVRAARGEAEQEEVDLSYIRRMVQGRIDIVRAELARRGGDQGGPLMERLAAILSDEERSPSRGLGRHSTLEPSRADQHRRYVERLVADVDLSDVSARSDDELRHALEVLADEEQSISGKRREVQKVMDACSAEITRRYRDGEADVSNLLGAS